MSDNDFFDARGRPRVVVTGIGAKTPAGNDPDTMWETVTAGRGTAGIIERWDASALPVQFACEVKDFDPTTVLRSEGSRAARTGSRSSASRPPRTHWPTPATSVPTRAVARSSRQPGSAGSRRWSSTRARSSRVARAV